MHIFSYTPNEIQNLALESILDFLGALRHCPSKNSVEAPENGLSKLGCCSLVWNSVLQASLGVFCLVHLMREIVKHINVQNMWEYVRICRFFDSYLNWCVSRREVRFPSGKCVSRRGGAFPVGKVRFPSGCLVFRQTYMQDPLEQYQRHILISALIGVPLFCEWCSHLRLQAWGPQKCPYRIPA